MAKKNKRSSKRPAAVESIRHKERRVNIPTEELRDFVAADEAGPKTMLYPRDPSLDPQLVWKGKDEQDRQDLAAQRGWLLVTRDERIRMNPAELRALRQYTVGVFFLSGKNRSRCDLIQQSGVSMTPCTTEPS